MKIMVDDFDSLGWGEALLELTRSWGRREGTTKSVAENE